MKGFRVGYMIKKILSLRFLSLDLLMVMKHGVVEFTQTDQGIIICNKTAIIKMV